MGRDVTVKLSVSDHFSAQLRAFADGVDKADKAGGKMKTGLAGLNSRLEQNQQQFMSNYGTVLGYAGAGLGVLAGATSYAIKQAMDQEQAMAQTDAVIKSTGGTAGKTSADIENLAGKLSEMSGVQDDVIQSGANMLLTFKEVKGDSFDRASEAILDMAVAMNKGSLEGIDLQGASIQVGKALNVVAGDTAGASSALSALSRVGVSFTAEQKEAAKAAIEVGDTLAFQAIVLKELESEFGGAAEAAGNTTAGAFAKLKNETDELAEALGVRLLPAATAAAKMATGRLDAFSLLNEAFQKGAIDAGEYAKTLFTLSTFGPDASQEIDFLTTKIEEETRATEVSIDAHDRAASTTVALTEQERALNAQTSALTSVWQSYSPSVSDAAVKNGEMLIRINELTGASSDLKFGLADVTKEIIFQTASAGLNAEEAYQMAVGMGLVSEKAASTKSVLDELRTKYEEGELSSKQYRDAVAQLGDAVNGLPNDKNINITVSAILQGAAMQNIRDENGNVSGQAMGGPVMAGQPYWVGEHGPELMVPKQNGTVIPNGEATSMGGTVVFGPGSITVTGAPGNDEEYLANLVAEKVSIKLGAKLRAARNAGMRSISR